MTMYIAWCADGSRACTVSDLLLGTMITIAGVTLVGAVWYLVWWFDQ